jgi:hypothetical protein
MPNRSADREANESRKSIAVQTAIDPRAEKAEPDRRIHAVWNRASQFGEKERITQNT